MRTDIENPCRRRPEPRCESAVNFVFRVGTNGANVAIRTKSLSDLCDFIFFPLSAIHRITSTGLAGVGFGVFIV